MLVFAAIPASAYSVLTHQANIDSTWERCLVPAIMKRYPGTTPEELLMPRPTPTAAPLFRTWAITLLARCCLPT